MMEKNIKQIVEQYAQAHQAEQLELLRTLGKIPAPTRQEDMRAAFVRDWLLAQGARDVTIDKAKNVICKIGCEDHEDLVAFAAHTDIVFPDTETLPMEEKDAKYILQNGTRMKYGVLIVANACEEGLGNLDGAKQLFADYGTRIKAFYSFDGYTPQCTYTAVGSYRYRVSCKTVGGHSYVNYGNPNAIRILCELVAELYKIEPPAEVKTTYNVGRIEGGTTVNSIAQEASMLYEFRSTSQKCLEEMEGKFNAAVESCRGRGGELTVELLGVRPGNGPLDEAALAEYTRRSADIIQTFYDGDADYAPQSTDSNIPLSLGIPANTIGTVLGGLAHTREEWVDLSSLPMGLKIALSTVLQYAEA